MERPFVAGHRITPVPSLFTLTLRLLTEQPSPAPPPDPFTELKDRLDRIEGLCSNQTTPQPSPYLDYDEAAAYIGCAKRTLQNAVWYGGLEKVPGGPGVRFTRDSLDQWRTKPRRKRRA